MNLIMAVGLTATSNSGVELAGVDNLAFVLFAFGLASLSFAAFLINRDAVAVDKR